MCANASAFKSPLCFSRRFFLPKSSSSTKETADPIATLQLCANQAPLTSLQVVDGVELVEQGAGAEQGGFAAGPGAATDDGHAQVRAQEARPPRPALLRRQPIPLPLQPLLLPSKGGLPFFTYSRVFSFLFGNLSQPHEGGRLRNVPPTPHASTITVYTS